jgi:hypothetical protein
MPAGNARAVRHQRTWWTAGAIEHVVGHRYKLTHCELLPEAAYRIHSQASARGLRMTAFWHFSDVHSMILAIVHDGEDQEATLLGCTSQLIQFVSFSRTIA